MPVVADSPYPATYKRVVVLVAKSHLLVCLGFISDHRRALTLADVCDVPLDFAKAKQYIR